MVIIFGKTYVLVTVENTTKKKHILMIKNIE